MILTVRRRRGFDTDLVMVAIRDPLAVAPTDPTLPTFVAPPPDAGRPERDDDVVILGVVAAPSSTAAFDSEGIGAGDLLRLDDTFQLFFGGRGRRQNGVGFQASDDLRSWTPKRVLLTPDTDPLLAAGLTDPDAAVLEQGPVVVFTMGEGADARIGLITREPPR